ncbi:MAG TPA: ATP-binding protein [Anaerolineales bacterium]|nr:ATP-binding protein [Anaerolineales bacterium]
MRLALPNRLHARLIFSHLMVALISITLISAFAASSIFSSAREQTGHNTEDLAFAASNALEEPMQAFYAGDGTVETLLQAVQPYFARNPHLNYTIFLPDGRPLVSSYPTLPPEASPEEQPEFWEAINSSLGESERVGQDANGNDILHIAVRVAEGNEIFGVLVVDVPLDPTIAMQTARRSLALLLLTDLLVAVGVSLFGWLLAGNLARPIQDLTQTADRLARGDMEARAQPHGPLEYQRLAKTFNIMAGRIQDNVNELRAFVANASHELRTPLTVVKLRAEALRNGALEDPKVSEQFLSEIESEVDRLSHMVTDLLDLSRMEAGLAPRKRALLNMGNIATDVYETFSIRSAKAGIDLNLHIEPNLPPVMGNEDQLRRVLYNLVDNAIKYTPHGGAVDMYLQSGRNRQFVRLQVRDTGPGISPEHMPHIFERFYRVEATRPRYGPTKGSGLGLAIAKSIVESHAGRIGVSSQLHEGTTFWAEIPAAV